MKTFLAEVGTFVFLGYAFIIEGACLCVKLFSLLLKGIPEDVNITFPEYTRTTLTVSIPLALLLAIITIAWIVRSCNEDGNW